MLLQLEWYMLPTPTTFSKSRAFGLLVFPVTAKFFDGKTFSSNKDSKNNLDQFFTSKSILYFIYLKIQNEH